MGNYGQLMHLWLIMNVKKEKEKTEELGYKETSVGHISFMFIIMFIYLR